MTLVLRAARLLVGAAVAGAAASACYTAGQGSPPPMKSFYFPTGLATSSGGNVLYAANSDFDLQWNGGTLQSYDLFAIRHDTAALIQANIGRASSPPTTAQGTPIPFLAPGWVKDCIDQPPPPQAPGSGLGVELPEACAPPVDSTAYVRDSAIVGAFATDLQLSRQELNGNMLLFSPVAGNSTVTWAKIAYDDPKGPAPVEGSTKPFPPFALDCGARTSSRCDGFHQVGNDPFSEYNSRQVTIPGQPFGMAQSEDGSAIAVTTETQGSTALLTTGFGSSNRLADYPTMQFVINDVPNGGVGIAAVPHDPYAVTRCEDVGDREGCIRPAFLMTNQYTNEVDLIRYYDDDGSSLHRPFIVKERSWTITSNAGGSNFRGVAFDPTPRLACEAHATTKAQRVACGQIPARVFIASRTPGSLVYGAMGGPDPQGNYDPDQLIIQGLVSLNSTGPSNVYVAPVVLPGADGVTPQYYVRVFVVLFDVNQVAVVDPENPDPAHTQYINVGQGPFAMAFDPFSLEDVATHATVPVDTRQPADLALLRYRFAYVASFTQSYLQVVDLDAVETGFQTFGDVVFTLGSPTLPKGSAQANTGNTFL